MAMSWQFAAVALLCMARAAALGAGPALKTEMSLRAGSTITALVPKATVQKLTICNGYASNKSVEVFLQGKKLIEAPLAYKACEIDSAELGDSDVLEFKAGGSTIGSFTTSGMPKATMSLLLVLHRRSLHSHSIAFQSHTFSQLNTAQIAIIDTYHGGEKSHVEIADADQEKDSKEKDTTLMQRSETLKFSSVVAVNPGKYDVSLVHSGSSLDASKAKQLVAESSKSYVAMRVGHGHEFEEELVLFGTSGAVALRLHAFVALALAAIAGLLAQAQ